MEKSGSGRYPTVKSNLNLVREAFILVCSLILWVYCAVVIHTFMTIFMGGYTFITQLILTIIKIEPTEIKGFFWYLGICVIGIVVYLLINYKFNSFEVKEDETH
jgi:hypothetical protein